MTKEQRKEIEEFARSEWELWAKVEPDNKATLTTVMTYSYLSGRFPNMKVKTAYKITNELTKKFDTEER